MESRYRKARKPEGQTEKRSSVSWRVKQDMESEEEPSQVARRSSRGLGLRKSQRVMQHMESEGELAHTAKRWGGMGWGGRMG